MKRFTLFIVAAILMIAMAATASAVSVSYDVVEDDTLADVYTITATVTDTEGTFRGYKNTLSFDTSVIIPVSKTKGTEANIAGGTVKTPIQVAVFYEEENEEDVEVSYAPGSPKWTVDGTSATLDVETYSSTFFDASNLVVFEMHFKFAEGKTANDITADVFSVDYIHYGNGSDHIYNNGESNAITLVNNVVKTPAAPTKLTIAVAAGDVVYLQDGTVVTIAEANEAYEIPTTAGTVVVNSGFAGQKVYTVADNKVTEDTAKADGVLSTNEASIRDDETASGIRYKSTFLTALKEAVDEYGYITTVESAYNALPANYVLDMALVDAGKAVKDEAYIKGTDVDTFWNVDGDKTVVTAVVTNVPMTKEGVTTNIVIRPYYKVGEFVVYGEPMTRTVYEVALNIKTNDAETYAKYHEYIDEILALCEEADVVIDFGPLFK